MNKRRRKILILIVPVLPIVFFLHSCMTFRMSHREISKYFKERNIPAEQSSFRIGFREIHYVKTGDDSKPLVLFVHGSPGSLSAFIHFLADTSLCKRFTLITVDRPGFGYSNFGVAEPSLKEQGALIRPIIEKYGRERPVTLVGHSLGAPVIVRMAIDYPDLVDRLIIIAGSIDPALEPNERWFRVPLSTPFLSWILPRSFRSSNDEILALKPQLEKMIPLWRRVKIPVTVIQGGSDTFVDKGNAAFAKRMLVNAPVDVVFIEGMDHFVPWSNPKLINDAILREKFVSKHMGSIELSPDKAH
jgi:pimeloyl-ACP methyl ester carboxylesterase